MRSGNAATRSTSAHRARDAGTGGRGLRPHAPPPLPSAAVPHSDSRAASTDMLPHRLRQQRQPQREELKRQAPSWQQVGLGLLQDAAGDVGRGPLLVPRGATSRTSCNHERGRTPPQLESEQSATLSPQPVTLSHPTQLVRRRVVMGHAGRVAGAEPGQRSAVWVVRRVGGSRGAGASASDAGPPDIEAAAGSGGDNSSSAPHLAAGNGVGSATHTPALKLQRQRARAAEASRARS
ncbi:hypothetical protein HaLaN_10368 [Haematococcus lacustris]|uniref:Uncharacterized protein n=1 Tax=Haematococcus lacustris TaxID=44745 RepID=A0A699YVR9_HAELA|nr:hypothetical protein HaLaN_10368 [Haematococcus lacustris]